MGFSHSLVKYQNSHSFAVLTRSISDTSATRVKIKYACAFHEVISICFIINSQLKELRAHYFISENYREWKYNHFTETLQIEKFPNVNGIVRPNSLWTAGCCVVPGASTQWPQSIAVWGNNHKIDAETEVMSLTDLEQLLVTSTSPADLFPAFPGCRTNSYLSLDQLSSVLQWNHAVSSYCCIVVKGSYCIENSLSLP